MKEPDTAHWASPNTGATNESGYSGLPGGYRDYYGTFVNIGSYGIWWSSKEHTPVTALHWQLISNFSNVNQGDSNFDEGFSVRCVKD